MRPNDDLHFVSLLTDWVRGGEGIGPGPAADYAADREAEGGEDASHWAAWAYALPGGMVYVQRLDLLCVERTDDLRPYAVAAGSDVWLDPHHTAAAPGELGALPAIQWRTAQRLARAHGHQWGRARLPRLGSPWLTVEEIRRLTYATTDPGQGGWGVVAPTLDDAGDLVHQARGRVIWHVHPTGAVSAMLSTRAGVCVVAEVYADRAWAVRPGEVPAPDRWSDLAARIVSAVLGQEVTSWDVRHEMMWHNVPL